MLSVDLACALAPSTKNSYCAPPPAVKVISVPKQMVLSRSDEDSVGVGDAF
ncbi:hypothetical protein DSECCO2_204340 [anaerobic digester metagenome]